MTVSIYAFIGVVFAFLLMAWNANRLVTRNLALRARLDEAMIGSGSGAVQPVAQPTAFPFIHGAFVLVNRAPEDGEDLGIADNLGPITCLNPETGQTWRKTLYEDTGRTWWEETTRANAAEVPSRAACTVTMATARTDVFAVIQATRLPGLHQAWRSLVVGTDPVAFQAFRDFALKRANHPLAWAWAHILGLDLSGTDPKPEDRFDGITNRRLNLD